MTRTADVFTLRPAEPADVEAVLTIKRRLAMVPRPGETASGGFILGAERETYERLIAAGCVELLAVAGAVVGYAVALPDAVLRASDVWRRRAQIEWDGAFDPAPLEPATIGYFDQLAVLPGVHVRAYGAALGLRALARLFCAPPGGGGHEYVLTTTLRAPVRNIAAHAYLRRVGARSVGVIVERYPEVGEVVSDIFVLDRETFLARARGYAAGPARVAGLAARALEPLSG